MKPLGKRVVVQPNKESDTVLASGIIVPNSVTSSQTQTGIVRYLGDESIKAKVGDIANYETGRGVEVTYNDEKLLILNNEDILWIQTTKGGKTTP